MDLQDILDKLGQLQATEEGLYSTLTQNAENVALGQPNTFTDSEIDEITARINTLSTTRVNLYNTISDTYHSQATNESVAKESLDQQTKTLGLLEKELNKSKKRLTTLEDERYNKLKMVEINTYYSEQYSAYSNFMKMFSLIIIALLLAVALSYIPVIRVMSKPLIYIISLVGSILIIRSMVNLAMRRKDNYNEFLWPIAPATDTGGDSTTDVGITVDMPYLCSTSSCCSDGTIWSNSGCIPDPTGLTSN